MKSFDILIRGLKAMGVLFLGTLLGGVRRVTPGPAPGEDSSAHCPPENNGVTWEPTSTDVPSVTLALRPMSKRPGYSSGTFWHSGRPHALSTTLFYHLEPRRVRLAKSVSVREGWAHRGCLIPPLPIQGRSPTGLSYCF